MINRPRRSPIGWIIAIGLSIGLIALIVLRSAWAPPVQDLSRPFLAQIQYLLSGLPAMKQEWQLYRQEALKQKAVQEELAQLRRQLKAMNIVATENQRLRELLQLPIPKGFEKVGANIIARSPSQWFSRMQIDKGFEDGLALNRVVMNRHGVIGKITELSARTAMVQLLTDPDSAVSCLTERQHKPAILAGSGPGELGQLKYLENYTRVASGEKILTSGLGGTYPPDLLLGTVSEVLQRAGHPVPDVKVKLAAFAENLREVVVLVPEP
jgi:rod shape-determining protein MreC